MKVKIALIVGSNGKASAMELESADWGLLADNIMDYDPSHKVMPTDPETSTKYIIEVDVVVPKVATITGLILPSPTLGS